MIVVGISAFVATLTLVVAPLIQKRMEGVLSIMDKFQFKNHVVISGYNALARYLVKALGVKANLDCVFITRHQIELEEAEIAGFQAFVGNIHAKEDLISLGAQSAKYVVFVSDNDADNILGAMAMLQIKNEKSAELTKVIVRVEQEMNVDKAYQAGADLVISASQLAGNRIAEKLLEKF
jgi:Trk K+ transport system NAD-binding subunit